MFVMSLIYSLMDVYVIFKFVLLFYFTSPRLCFKQARYFSFKNFFYGKVFLKFISVRLIWHSFIFFLKNFFIYFIFSFFLLLCFPFSNCKSLKLIALFAFYWNYTGMEHYSLLFKTPRKNKNSIIIIIKTTGNN